MNIESDLDALFKLPLAEFTGARNALAARLKKAGHGHEADQVKSLAKPSISAWAVNQLYWRHRDAFNRLIAAGENFARAQKSQLDGKTADTRGPLAERREALSSLSRLASALLSDAGHNATSETLRRITTTLEALSTGSSFSAGPSAGRLTEDIGPPGFESLAAFIPGAGQPERSDHSTRVIPFQPAAGKREEKRQARISAAQAALQTAERNLRTSQTLAQNLVVALKETTAHADETEKDLREAEERLRKANTAAEKARHRLQNVKDEAAKAATLLENAENRYEKARKELNEQTET